LDGWQRSNDRAKRGEDPMSELRIFSHPPKIAAQFSGVMALRLLLAVLGALLSAASRSIDGMRAAITRDLVIGIETGDGVAQRFVFRARTMRSESGREASADCTIRFASSRQALAALASRSAMSRIYEGVLDGTVRIDGNPFHAMWFYDLTQWVVPLAARPAWSTPPGAYVEPNTIAAWAKRITREPVAAELDPKWEGAARNRAKLKMMRVVAGEPALRY
jgi:hypothetical protein